MAKVGAFGYLQVTVSAAALTAGPVATGAGAASTAAKSKSWAPAMAARPATTKA